MKCDRCKLERTTYKYLGKNYCLPCNYGIYAVGAQQQQELKAHIQSIHDKIEKAQNQLQQELAL